MHIVEGRRNTDSKLRLGFALFYNVLSARKIYFCVRVYYLVSQGSLFLYYRTGRGRTRGRSELWTNTDVH